MTLTPSKKSLLLRIEHFIYCVTNCRIELPKHKHYYNYTIEQNNPNINPKFDW